MKILEFQIRNERRLWLQVCQRWSSVMDTLLEWIECVWREFAGLTQWRECANSIYKFFHPKLEYDTNEIVIRCPVAMFQQKMSPDLGLDEITVISASGPASSNSGPPSVAVLTQLLQSSAADWEAECKRQHKNGNIAPRQGKAGGKNLDQTCLRLAIEWPWTTSGGRATVQYFCIACDKFHANNSQSHTFEHADQCNGSVEFDILMTQI